MPDGHPRSRRALARVPAAAASAIQTGLHLSGMAWLARLPRRWNERYGWEASVSLAALSASLFAFAFLVERVAGRDEITRWDVRFNHWLDHEAWGPFVAFFELATIPGSTVFLFAVTLAAAALLASRGDRADAALIVMAYGSATVVNLALKLAIERPRPAFHDPDLTFSTFSFPSGHASASVAAYGAFTLILLRELRTWRARLGVVGAVALLLVVIGFSRVYLGAHYFSDVLAGFSIGTACLAACVLGLTLREAHRRHHDDHRARLRYAGRR